MIRAQQRYVIRPVQWIILSYVILSELKVKNRTCL